MYFPDFSGLGQFSPDFQGGLHKWICYVLSIFPYKSSIRIFCIIEFFNKELLFYNPIFVWSEDVSYWINESILYASEHLKES